ncbi:hypothetical protein ACFE04_000840 [Oxalis oulophora]
MHMLLILFFFFFFFFTLTPHLTLSLNQEGIILQQIKQTLSDPDSTLSSWNPRDTTPCNNWYGITCDSLTRSVVNSVDLSNTNIAGPFPLLLCRLKNLTFLSLYNNYINGSLPFQINQCKSLQHLDLAQNLLTGELPYTLSEITNLAFLNLAENNFSGDVPESFALFEKLEVISLVYNLLDGYLPGFLGNVSTLKMVNLSYNPFLPGRIPEQFGSLSNLEVLWLTECNLVGEIPESLGNLKRLTDLDLALNDLHGVIPSTLTELTSVVQIELFNNSLTGELPAGWGNLTKLRLLDASMNQLSGVVPDELTRLPLESLNLYENRFEGTFPESIADSPNLYELRIFRNRFTGPLPKNLGRNSPLRWLDISNNQFSGEMPASLCDKAELEELLVIFNSFSGQIPASLGECRSLRRVRLGNNRLSGDVPAGLWGLPHVNLLELSDNALSGTIAKTIVGASNLSLLLIQRNSFEGSIPEEIGFLDKLVQFSGSENKLSGSLPGSIKLKLNQLNLSNNKLSGNIPPLFAKDMYKLSFSGNPGLCRESEGLCDDGREIKNKGYIWLLRSTFILAGFVLVCGIAWFYFNYKNFKQARAIDKSKWTLMSFHKLGFSELEILDALDEDNVIGSGSSGKVYKVTLGNGEAVAVKKLWGLPNKECQPGGDIEKGPVQIQDDGFQAEVETLGKIRHKNIVKLWCCCSTRDCKLLVYEYMPNGSLGDLLHSTKAGLLVWPTRFKIVVDAAEGLSYLHHDCVPSIVHRDVKSNNILLDGDFGARVADFGVAKVVDVTGKGSKSMSVIAGSCGYIAPEYAYTLRVNEKSDIYSFGVVILELVTGKRPISPEFGEKDLVNWVCTTLDQKGVDHIIDTKLDSCFKEEICKVLNIGLLCTSPLPINRPSMRRVVKMLQVVGAENQSKSKKDGKLTPYYYEDNSDHESVTI